MKCIEECGAQKNSPPESGYLAQVVFAHLSASSIVVEQGPARPHLVIAVRIPLGFKSNFFPIVFGNNPIGVRWNRLAVGIPVI